MKQIATNIRKNILHIANLSGSPHIGSALSCTDILTTLYFKILNLDDYENRDLFILSKAHSAMTLYATLHEKGLLSKDDLEGYYQNGGTLPAHTDRLTNPYIEISAGSLGHGLPIASGMAHALKLKGSERKVYVLMGDGESQEGSVWEAAMLAPKLELNNLTVFIDRNNLQGYARADEILSYEPIDKKFEAFNWEVFRIDGHDYKAILDAVNTKTNKPKMIICDTTKGKGVSFMEDELIWHYYIVTDEIKQKAILELEGSSDEK
ncbi:transketolase [Sulfurimonas sp.]|uniref:transketolase n=1 Tax=Sulfurimonas sp. TaxID=2022749 RepID=UPI003568827E